MSRDFRFRIRFRLERTADIPDLREPVSVVLSIGAPPVELALISPATHDCGPEVVVRCGRFCAEDDALRAGTQAQLGLMLMSVSRGFGLQLSPRVPSGRVTAAGRELLGRGHSNLVLDDALGLIVYEHVPGVRFVSVGAAHVRASMGIETFVQAWDTASKEVGPGSQGAIVAYDLYASSRMESSSRARFLLLVMAIEALATQGQRSRPEVEVIDRLLRVVRDSELNDQQRHALATGVGNLKRLSIQQSCRKLICGAIDAKIGVNTSAADDFARCYAIRSRLVHGGEAPAPEELASEANTLEPTVRSLVASALRSRDDHGICGIWAPTL